MKLAIFLAIGESWEDFEEKGQDQLWLTNNLHYYSRNFERVWVFSYGQRRGRLLPNVELIPNRWKLHRFLYAFLLPIFHWHLLIQTSVLRGYQLTGALPGIIAKFFYRKPLVINYGYDYPAMAKVEGRRFRAFLFQLLEKLLLPLCDEVFVTTESLKSRIASVSPRKVTVIPNSVNTSVFKPKDLPKTIDILFVGRLTKQKNLTFLLDAVVAVGLRRKPKVVFVGSATEGSLQKDLLQRARRQSLELTVLPAVPHGKLVDYYNRSRIVALPSLLEGHPKVLLEAMSCGAAVIGMDSPGVRDVIINQVSGFLLPEDVINWKHGIESLLTSPALRSRLGKKARKTVLTNYDSQKIWYLEIKLLKSLG